MRLLSTLSLIASALFVFASQASAYSYTCGGTPVDVGPQNEATGDYCGSFATATELVPGTDTIEGLLNGNPFDMDRDYFIIPDAEPNVAFSFGIIVTDSTGVVVRIWDENETLLFQDTATSESSLEMFFSNTPATGALYLGLFTAQESFVGYTLVLDVERVVPEPTTASLLALGLVVIGAQRRHRAR